MNICLKKNMGPMGPRGLGPNLLDSKCNTSFFFQDFGRPKNKKGVFLEK